MKNLINALARRLGDEPRKYSPDGLPFPPFSREEIEAWENEIDIECNPSKRLAPARQYHSTDIPIAFYAGLALTVAVAVITAAVVLAPTEDCLPNGAGVEFQFAPSLAHENMLRSAGTKCQRDDLKFIPLE